MRRSLAVLCLLMCAAHAGAQVPTGIWNKRGDRPTMQMTVESAGSAFKITYKIIAQDVKATERVTLTVVTQLDGNDAQVLLNGQPSGETMAIRRIDDSHMSTIVKFNGTLFGTSKSELSPDGRTLKVENHFDAAAPGQSPGNNVEYWDKQ